MKRFSCLVLPLVLCAAPLGPAAVCADPPKTAVAKCVLRVDPEIDCPSCEDGIKRILTTARGVVSADVDVLTDRITVRYDPARINVKALIGRIAVTGYTASEVR